MSGTGHFLSGIEQSFLRLGREFHILIDIFCPFLERRDFPSHRMACLLHFLGRGDRNAKKLPENCFGQSKKT